MEKIIEPPKSLKELVLEPKKGSSEIKELIKESPPPIEKVIASVADVKNIFRDYKRNALLTKIKLLNQEIKKQVMMEKEDLIVVEKEKKLEIPQKDLAKISREGGVGIKFNDKMMVPEGIRM